MIAYEEINSYFWLEVQRKDNHRSRIQHRNRHVQHNPHGKSSLEFTCEDLTGRLKSTCKRRNG